MKNSFLPTETPGPNLKESRAFQTSGLAPAGFTTPHTNLFGKAMLALAKYPVSLELPAGAVLFLVCGLILIGISLRRA